MPRCDLRLTSRCDGGNARWRPAGVTVLLADRATLGLTDADFADIIHLNRAGARKLSAWTRDAVNALPAPAVGRGAADGAAP